MVAVDHRRGDADRAAPTWSARAAGAGRARHVDTALVEDVLRAGGGVYRTHDAGYLMVRHGDRHTWEADDAEFLVEAESVHRRLAPGARRNRGCAAPGRALTRDGTMPDRAGRGPPRVSVVIPTRDRAELLPRAVGSVLAQTWTDFELLIVDDHSTDGTPAVVARFADGRIRSLRHERNRGQSKALNTGIEHARGEYVAFLDDDDEWLPGKLAAQVALLDAAPPEVGLVYCWRDELDETTGRRIGTTRLTLRGDIFEHVLALHLPASPSSWLVRRSTARSVGGFDEGLRAGEGRGLHGPPLRPGLARGLRTAGRAAEVPACPRADDRPDPGEPGRPRRAWSGRISPDSRAS